MGLLYAVVGRVLLFKVELYIFSLWLTELTWIIPGRKNKHLYV